MHHTRCKMWQAGRCSQGGADCDGRHHSHNQRVRSPLQARQRTLKCRWAQRTTAQRHRRCGSPLPFEGAHTLAPCAATPFHTHQTQIVRCSPSRPPAAMHGCTHAQLTVPCSSDSGITRTRSRSYIEGVGFQVHGHERRWLHGPCRVAQGHRAAASRGVLTDCEYPAPSDVPNHMLASPVGVGDGGGFGESRCRRGSG
jgi:hypothetical protein